MKQLINRRTLHSMIPLAERTIYDMEKRGDFPRRIALTSRKVVWDLAEVQEWIESRRQQRGHAAIVGAMPPTVA